MSIRACDQVWRRSKAKGSELLLLLAIADCANDEGTHAYPSIATLADKTRLTQRQVINLVKSLEAGGELSVQRPRVRRTGLSNVYTLHVGDLNPAGANFSGENISREVAARSSEAGFTTTVLVEPSEDDTAKEEARTLWLDILAHATLPGPIRQMLADVPVRLEGGDLVVQSADQNVRRQAGYLGLAAAPRRVRFAI